MPELCHIYMPIHRTCSNQEYAMFRRQHVWDLTRRKVMYGRDKQSGEWTVKVEGAVLVSEKLYALKDAITIIAKRGGGFTDYAEAKAFIARKNA